MNSAMIPGQEDIPTLNMVATELRKLKVMAKETDKVRLRDLELEFCKKLITIDISDTYNKALLMKSLGIVSLKYKPFFTIVGDVQDQMQYVETHLNITSEFMTEFLSNKLNSLDQEKVRDKNNYIYSLKICK
jgi:hypothetical protein